MSQITRALPPWYIMYNRYKCILMGLNIVMSSCICTPVCVCKHVLVFRTYIAQALQVTHGRHSFLWGRQSLCIFGHSGSWRQMSHNYVNCSRDLCSDTSLWGRQNSSTKERYSTFLTVACIKAIVNKYSSFPTVTEFCAVCNI